MHKLIIENGATKIKIEPNFIMRGTLLPIRKMDISKAVENEFINMTEKPVSLVTLLSTREELITVINQTLSSSDREFILSMKKGDPDYSLMPSDNLEDFPALKWTLINIRNMDKSKHKAMLKKLTVVLEG